MKSKKNSLKKHQGITNSQVDSLSQDQKNAQILKQLYNSDANASRNAAAMNAHNPNYGYDPQRQKSFTIDPKTGQKIYLPFKKGGSIKKKK